MTAVALALADQAPAASYEILDTTAVPTRNRQRGGAGHLAGLTDIGYSHRLRWYEGLHLLACVQPPGLITGVGCGSARAHDRALAETLFAVRAAPDARLPEVGHQRGRLRRSRAGATATR